MLLVDISLREKILDEAYGMLEVICYSKNSSHKRLYLIPRTQRGFLF